jgi:hypothetical protein
MSVFLPKSVEGIYITGFVRGNVIRLISRILKLSNSDERADRNLKIFDLQEQIEV